MKRFGYFLLPLLLSILLAKVFILITGFYGDIPCGEDGWRWGLAQAFIEIPAFMIGFLFACVSAYYNKITLRKRVALLGVQIMLSVVVVGIIVWPNIFYEIPQCI
jgi:hypothetical protein